MDKSRGELYNKRMKTIDNDIKDGRIKKAYLLYGEERYLIRQYRDYMQLVPAVFLEKGSEIVHRKCIFQRYRMI